jgi:ABC-2 type transport system ATP-binding protein
LFAGTNMSAVAVFENVGKMYPTGMLGKSGVQAVKGVNLHVPRGVVFGLLGPNRAGKTTLVKLLLSLCRPNEGKITRLDKPAIDVSTLARVGYMHENQNFPRYLTAVELLNYYGGLSLVAVEKLKSRVLELLNLVGLADRKDEPISRFSKGMVQRLGLAQALLNEPELLILDEPTEGLDLLGRQLLRKVIAAQKARGATVLIVSHVLSEVEQTCDRVAVIVGGRIVKVSNISDLLKDPKTGQTQTLEQVLQPIYLSGVAE